MYRKILVPMALDHGVSAQTLAIANALKTDDAELIALHVYEAPQGAVLAYLDDGVVEVAFERARETLNEKVAGIDGITPVVVSGHSARAIIDYATDNAVDCIVIGSHKPGLSEYFLGTTASRVVRHAPCAVHVHRSS
ncbi:universal stress protein [Yoonia sp. 208BN28-4]|uniref:universal stress protein n=1 Tax=Yoonia sp. 208BN28-4 TaxID=3126505 RepID=UPI003096CDDD